MNKGKSLIIWLATGKTLKFEKVEDFIEFIDSEISFTYFGVSTKKKRRAKFYTKNIAGYALELEELK